MNETPLQLPRQTVEVISADENRGLTARQAAHRLESGWANTPPESASLSEKQIVLRHTFTFFNLMFLVLALILAIAGSSIKNMTFLIIVVCNCVIGIVQEIRAKRAVDSLTLVVAQRVPTLRDGEVLKLRSEELVRDDIVILSAGDQICADGVVRSGEIQVNEALVTGEEDAIHKSVGDTLKSGSFVVAGTARVQLTRVGNDSFASRLALEAKSDPHATKSEMMRSLDRLIQVVGFLLVPIGIMLFYQHYVIMELALRNSAESTVSALVGMIPEGLYLLTSVAMAVSAIKLSRQRVLVQDMNCIEALARVDVLCVDKTGTITEAKMDVDNVIPLTNDPPERLEQILAAIYSAGEPENDTARAMAEMFAHPTDWVCTRSIPFTSQTKWSATEFRGQGTFVVGAPEFTMGSRYDEIRETVESWSCKGYRVLLIAQHIGELGEILESGKLTPLALILLTNRIRPEAEQTFAYFASQNVTVKVISGDNPMTVSEVAARAGIPHADRFVDAGTLETEEDVIAAAEEYTVFGRVTPDKKKMLIRALKAAGHTVAMTGDGVNDVLAMKEADCSIAMASGSQAASQVARLVLLDNDFSAMPSIVGEGRRVINNIQRAATLFLVKNIFSLGLSLLTMITAWPYPFVPLHLSVISALTIGAPSFLLALEPNFEQIKGHFLRGVLRRAFPGGLTNIFVVLMAQAFGYVFLIPQAQISSIATSLLAVVGLLVLFQTCKPFDTFRKLIWGTMTVGVILCFTFLGSFFELQTGSDAARLVMAALVIMTPTVFFAVQRVFDWGDKLTVRIRHKLKKD